MSGRREPSRRWALALCAGITLLAGVARLVPCFGDLWLDEVWTWFTARGLRTPWSVFTEVHHSNNHYLSTLWMVGLGRRAPWLYRLPSFVAGTLSIVLAAALAWQRDRLEAVFAALLVGSCFALLHFASEARGYAPAVFFALCALWALERDLGEPKAAQRAAGERSQQASRAQPGAQRAAGERSQQPGRAASIFGVCVVLGFLSQLVFVFFWAGTLAQSALRIRRSETSAARVAWRMARLHAAPLAVLAALAWVDLRAIRLGGGNPVDVPWLTARLVGSAFGLPFEPVLALPYAALAVAVVALGLHTLRRHGDDTWILGLVAIAGPALVFAALRPQVIAVRYFLVPIALTLLFAARALADLYRTGRGGRAAALALLALFVAGNGVHTAAFLEHGRGGYRDALRFAARHTEGSRVVVGSDHDFRTGLVLRFYADTLPRGKVLVYEPREQRSHRGPEWWIRHLPERPPAPLPRFEDARGNAYDLAAEFDHASLSGFWWGLYHRVDAGGAASSRRRSSAMPNDAPANGSAPSSSTRS